MSCFSRELVFLILQLLDEEKFKESVHKLEEESGFFFNMKHFEDMVTNGEWDKVERYLLGFMKVDENRYSMKIFFEIRKQKYLEALDRQEHGKAVEILATDLKIFSTFSEDLFKQLMMLLTLKDFRENEQLSKYSDTQSTRAMVFVELKKLIKANPLFRDKLQFPTLDNSRLRTLLNQSLNWQHQLCKNPKPEPDMKTLFCDHTCETPNGPQVPSPVTNPLAASMLRVAGFPRGGGPSQFQHSAAPSVTQLPGGMTNRSSMRPQAVLALAVPNNSGNSGRSLRIPRHFAVPGEVTNLPVHIFPMMYAGQDHAYSLTSADELPKTVVANLNQSSALKSMDFHPIQQTMLLVGTDIGEVSVWEVTNGQKLAFRNFEVWDIGSCTMMLQASLANEYTASINRVIWSPDGSLFGVAYSKHIVQLYSYNGRNNFWNHLEIDAHVGSVNDLAFSSPDKQLCIITCGEDRTIKVWDAGSGAKRYTFEGHEAPVYCVCPHFRGNVQFIFSTSVDGKIKAWLYDNMGSRVDYDAPGYSCTTMAYSSDGTRLFSCGINKDGESHIVEWDESEGSMKRAYLGLRKLSVGVVQFDTTKNRFLAAGDEFSIKYWDMDNVNLLTTTDADGGLPASPCVRFSKGGVMLAVSANNGIKILANAEGILLMRPLGNLAVTSSMVGYFFVAPVRAICHRWTGGNLRDEQPAVHTGGTTTRLDQTEDNQGCQRSNDESMRTIEQLMILNLVLMATFIFCQLLVLVGR